MRAFTRGLICGLALLTMSLEAAATDVSVSNIKRLAAQRETFLAEPKFSFTYGGEQFHGLPEKWKRQRQSCKLDSNRTAQTVTAVDQKTGLRVRIEGIEYRDFPVVEWTVWFKNTGTTNTPVLADIQALDVNWVRGNDGEFVLNGIKGDWTTADSYEPYQTVLAPGGERKFAPPPHSGKSTDGPNGWPYFNLQFRDGGVITAVGWPGQWASSFTRNASTGARVKAGQELTRLYLQPGEEIRTPLIALLFWPGTNVVNGQNLWRRWYMAYNVPHFDGKPLSPVTSIQVTGLEREIPALESYLAAGIKPDICWRDAINGGFTWYPSYTGPFKDQGTDVFGKMAWLNTGTWDFDTKIFPNGFKPFSDWAHTKGMKFMLWFEPERIGDPGSWLATNHPDWLLPKTDATVGAILNEGHPTAREWLINHVDGMIKSQGMDWYREDMNGNGPATAWRAADAENRQGLTENLYVQGHLAYWDELKRRNPQLRIDSCASGGRRNDLETMRRAVPLMRSDFVAPMNKDIVEGNQGHTYGLASWLPWQGSQSWSTNPYFVRSFYLPGFLITEANDYSGFRKEIDADRAAMWRKAYSECAAIAPYMLGDYYPLTPYSRTTSEWIAWQFDRAENGGGVVQAFRRKDCTAVAMVFKLQGLKAKATYAVKDFDGGTVSKTGEELMTTGLRVAIADAPGSAIFTYTLNKK